MNKENIVDTDADADRVEELMESECIEVGGEYMQLSDLVSDIQVAYKQLDEYKAGSLSMAQDLSEAAKAAEDETLQAILADMSDASFGVYLRLHRGDLELTGGRDGEYSGFLKE